MNRKPLAPAPTSVINVAQAGPRSHSRASHGGSGTYTEMRAQIWREREHEKQQRQFVNGGHNVNRDVESHHVIRKQGGSVSLSNVQSASSHSDHKVSHFSASEYDTADDVSSDKKGYLRVLPPSSFAMSSDNVSNMSTASSQISSSSSNGVVKKRSQTIPPQQPQPQQPQQQQSQPQQQSQQQPLQTQQPQQHPQQHQHTQHPSQPLQQQHHHFAPREDMASRLHSPLDTPEQTIGVDALQAAFSAKYYELANKCKNWEKYAAKLRAQLGVLEAENRVLKEQNSHLENENAQLQAVLRQEEKTRTQLQGRMSSLEDCLSQRSFSGGSLNAQYRAVEMLDYDHLSIPSAPSSAEKNSNEHAIDLRRTPYCSSNLQMEDRSEVRQQVASNHSSATALVHNTNTGRYSDLNLAHNPTIPPRDMSLEDVNSKWESMQSMDAVKSPQPTQSVFSPVSAAVEGRSSRLGNRQEPAEKQFAHQRSGTVGALGMGMPRPGSVLGGQRGHALTSQALAQQDAIEAIARPASAQRFNGTYLESNVSTTAASIVASTGVTKAALQSKRRSTVSGDRGPSLSLAQIVKGALTASGVVAAAPSASQSHQASPNERALNSSDYLQECVEKRREAMRSSFHAQQKGMTPASGGQIPSRPASRAASRLSTQSGTRSRSRAGSVHDAIPIAVEDIFCNPKTVKAHSTDTSPEFLTEQLAATSLDPHADITTASQRLMAATSTTSATPSDTQLNTSVKLMTRKELSAASSPSPSSLPSTSPHNHRHQQQQGDESISFERKLYIRFQEEMNTEEFQKFERCIQRYDFLDIPLEGNKGLITRVKRLLLVSDPDLRSKPDKLRVRQQLARDFEKMAKNFGQGQNSQQQQQQASSSSTSS